MNISQIALNTWVLPMPFIPIITEIYGIVPFESELTKSKLTVPSTLWPRISSRLSLNITNCDGVADNGKRAAAKPSGRPQGGRDSVLRIRRLLPTSRSNMCSVGFHYRLKAADLFGSEGIRLARAPSGTEVYFTNFSAQTIDIFVHTFYRRKCPCIWQYWT